MRYRFCEIILRKLIFRLKSKLYFGSLKPHPFDQIDPNGNAQYCLNKEGSVSIRCKDHFHFLHPLVIPTNQLTLSNLDFFVHTVALIAKSFQYNLQFQMTSVKCDNNDAQDRLIHIINNIPVTSRMFMLSMQLSY